MGSSETSLMGKLRVKLNLMVVTFKLNLKLVLTESPMGTMLLSTRRC